MSLSKSFSSMMEHNNILDAFEKSGVHGETWPKETYCVFEIRRKYGANKVPHGGKNEQGQHAEIGAIKTIEKFFKFNAGETIRIFINYSPCNDCADQLIEMVNEKEFQDSKVKLEIIFAQLYNVRRESCTHGQCNCHENLDETESENNARGLRRMARNEIILKAFTPELWSELKRLLEPKAKREKENNKMSEDLSLILGETLINKMKGLNW